MYLLQLCKLINAWQVDWERIFVQRFADEFMLLRGYEGSELAVNNPYKNIIDDLSMT